MVSRENRILRGQINNCVYVDDFPKSRQTVSGVSFLHNLVGNFLPTNICTNLSGRRKSYRIFSLTEKRRMAWALRNWNYSIQFSRRGFGARSKECLCTTGDSMKRGLGAVCAHCHIVLVGFLIAVAGCENIGLSPHPDSGSRAIERSPDRSGITREEVIGTVERIDRASNEIQLRTTEAKVIHISYDPATRVYSREREVGMEALRPRDLILARVSRASRGNLYADLIRLNDREETGSKR